MFSLWISLQRWMQMNSVSRVLLSIVVISVLMISQALFIIMPNESGLVVHLGDLRKDDNDRVLVYQSGLHFKLPLVDKLVKIDKRLQSFDVPSSRVLTQDQKSVYVDYYVKWYVYDFPLFYQRTGGNYYHAKELVRRKISDSLRAEFGIRRLSEIISGEERNQIIQTMQQAASESVENMGMRVRDVRLKRVDYPKEVTMSVYERMKSGRHRDAKRYRAEGNAQGERIKSEAEKEARILITNANRKSAEIVAKAKQQAAVMYNQAYAKAPDFYAFYLKMEGYKSSVSSKDMMLISPKENAFYSELSQ